MECFYQLCHEQLPKLKNIQDVSSVSIWVNKLNPDNEYYPPLKIMRSQAMKKTCEIINAVLPS